MEKNLWKLEFYSSDVISKEIIQDIISKFYLDRLTNNKLMLYMIKIRCSKDGMDTHPLSNIIISRGSQANLKSAILSIEEGLTNFYNRYLSLECYGLEVHYRELSPNEPIGIQGEKVSRNLKDMYREFIDSENYYENMIPNQFDYNLWEGYSIISDNETRAILELGDSAIRINKEYTSEYKKHIIRSFDNSKSIAIDTLDIKENNKFIRELTNKTITFNDGEATVEGKSSKFITKLDLSTNSSIFNIATFDLETRTVNGVMEVVSAAVYNDTFKGKTFHYLDYNHSVSDLLKAMIDYLFDIATNQDSDMKNNLTVYAHNLSGFDGIFIIKYLAKYSDLFNLVMRDDQIIAISITRDGADDKSITITFKDSLLLLPSSLDKLSKTFLNEADRKTSFDFNLLTDNDSLARYKKELLEYNLQDCVSLYKILEQFYNLIMKEFNINIINYSTLPGLAFAIYRSKFMPVSKIQKDIKAKDGNIIRTVVKYISQISITPHKLYKELYSGYIGGHVDVFKTWSRKWKLIYCYDVNSLYPSVMRDYSFPVGNPIYVDNMQDWESKFGIFCAKVICPDSLNMPLLMIHRKGNSIAPTGTWTGWYTSVELLKAQELGYSIEVNKGYIFEKDNIFSEYVDYLYNMRRQYDGKHPMNLICKLLLNSLYGRFGMSPVFTDFTLREEGKASKKTNIIIPLGDGLEICGTEEKRNLQVGSEDVLISLPIAMFITSYSRLRIYEYKEILGDNLLYTDTDSVFTTVPLPAHMVGPELGKMKLEYIAEDAVFLAPKVYGVKIGGIEVIKVKGNKGSIITLKDLKSLLSKDASISLNNHKWYKSIQDGKITIKNTLYTLAVTENKRRIIRNSRGFYYKTQPFKIY